MNIDQSSKPVVLITGGGTGIGAAVAREMANTHRVAICGRRRTALEKIAREINAFIIEADIGSRADAERCVAETVNAFGRLDALVLNAGIVKSGTFKDLSVEAWNETIQINLHGAYYIARSAISHLIEKKGAIVAVASLSALRSDPALAAYAVSKAGLLTMIQSIVRDHGHEGIRANVVCPGWVRTEMADCELQAIADQQETDLDSVYREATKFIPARRPAMPFEAAAPIAWLLSPGASYVNGAVLTIDGGASIVDAATLALE